MIENLVILATGVILGVFTGLVPGIHPNTVIFGTMSIYYSVPLNLESYLVFLIGISVSHTFHDFLPAIYLGAPDAQTALSALPGGDLAARGKAREAFLYTLQGGTFSILFLSVIAGLFYLVSPFIEKLLAGLVPYMVLFVMSFILFNSDDIVKSGTIAVLSGIFGVLSFQAPVNQHYVLMPVFSGLFAFPALYNAYSRERHLPVQERGSVEQNRAAKGGFLGAFAGTLTGILPGLSPAVSATILTPLIDLDRKEFLAALGGVNTSDILFSLVAVALLGKARTGASVAIISLGKVSDLQVLRLLGYGVIAAAASIPVAFQVSRVFLDWIEKVDKDRLVIGVSLLVLALNLYLAGIASTPLLFTGSAIGYAALRTGMRSNCMWVLLLPSLLHYTGNFI